MRRLIDLVKRLGPSVAALTVADRLLRRISGDRIRLVKYYFMAQPVPDTGARVARSGGLVVHELLEGDPRLASLDRPAEELKRRFDSASRCFAAWHGDALAGFLWFTERQYEEDEVRCTFRVHPADRAVWDLDVHVVPRFRLGRTFALLWDSAFKAMRAAGIRWSISRVAASNLDSIRAHQRLGARPTGWALFFLIGPLQFTMTSPGKLTCRWLEQRPYPVLVIRADPAAEPEFVGPERNRAPLAGPGPIR